MLKSLTRRAAIAGLAVSAIIGLSGVANAQSLADLKSANKIRIGLQLDNPPFGIVDASGQPDGYEADVAKLYAKKLGVPLEIVSITGPNRIPYLLTGRVDLLIAALSITPERAKQVQFSRPYATVDMLVFGQKDLAIKGVADLSGVSIAVPRGSAQDIAVTKQATGAQIQRFDDDPAASQALLSGQVQTVAATTTVVSQIEKVAPAGAFDTKFALYSAVFGMATRPGQDELKEFTNKFIEEIVADGSLNEINTKWFGKDLKEMKTPDYVQ
jgi:polar amino acid transport system substrate-binding protein